MHFEIELIAFKHFLLWVFVVIFLASLYLVNNITVSWDNEFSVEILC